MIDPTDLRFFQTLTALCDSVPGVDPETRAVFERAATTGDPVDLRAARLALDGLDAPVRDVMLSRLHQKMVTDLSAIWDSLPGATPPGRPN